MNGDTFVFSVWKRRRKTLPCTHNVAPNTMSIGHNVTTTFDAITSKNVFRERVSNELACFDYVRGIVTSRCSISFRARSCYYDITCSSMLTEPLIIAFSLSASLFVSSYGLQIWSFWSEKLAFSGQFVRKARIVAKDKR